MMKSVKVNLCEYDIENIISFDFSFDILKKLLVSMCAKNDLLGNRIGELTEKIEDMRKVNDYDKKTAKEIHEKLEKRIKSLENILKSGANNKTLINKKRDKKEDNNDNEKEDDHEDNDSNLSSMSIFLNEGENNSNANINSDQLDSILSRIDEVELKMKSYTPLSESNTISSKQNELLNRIKSFDLSLHNLRIKVNEFDIKDLFKGAKLENGNVDAAQLLFLNYEKQSKEKFDMIEAAQTQLTKDMQAIHSLIESSSVNKCEIAALNDQTHNLMKYIRDLDTKLYQIQKAFNLSNLGSGLIIPPIEDDRSPHQKDSQDQNSIVLPVDNCEQKKALTILNKKIKDIEKAIRRLTTAFDPDFISSEIKNLKELIGQKGTKSDVAHLKENFINIESGTIELQNSIQKHDDEFKKVTSSVSVLMKKIEGFHSSVIGVKSTYDNIKKISKGKIDDNGKYMETTLFNDFIKVFNREVDRLKKDYDDLNKKIETMLGDIKLKASDSDLKSVEDYLNTKIEEFKLSANKKFADKIDSNRSFKYLDMQIRQFFDVSVKSSNDKGGDNWLIAKKPVGGYSCASCESYIGDLQEKKEFIPWNKFNFRGETPFDQTMRTGNGFSHILNMLNLDSNKSGNTTKIDHDPNRIYESDGEVLNTKSNEVKQRKLPKLQGNKSAVEIGHLSDDRSKTPNTNQIASKVMSPEDNFSYKTPSEDQPKL